MEEDLRSQEPLIAHIHLEGLLGDGVDAVMDLEPLGRVTVVLAKLLSNVRAHITEGFLRCMGRDGGEIGEGRGGARWGCGEKRGRM